MVDIRRREEVTREIIHARHLLFGGIYDIEKAVLASSVGTHDYERGDYREARKLQKLVRGPAGGLAQNR